MMAGLREEIFAKATDTLNGAINDSVTSITTSLGALPNTTNRFRIQIDSEIMVVTAKSGVIYTVERGAEGTTAASHVNGSIISAYVTGEALEHVMRDNYGYTSYPLNRVLAEGVPKTVSDFTWVNQGSSTAAHTTAGGIYMTTPKEAAFNFRLLVMTAPSTPWKITAYVEHGPGANGAGSDFSYISLIGRESSTGKFIAATDRFYSEFAYIKMTNVTTFDSKLGGVDRPLFDDKAWLRLEDDGVDTIMSISRDGANWWSDVNWNEGRTAFMSGGVDQVGFGISSRDAESTTPFHFYNWILEQG